MELKHQVTSLEIAKQLKSLGVKQESLFSWYMYTSGDMNDGVGEEYKLMMGAPHKNTSETSAFTVAELGELLREVQTWIDCGDVCYDLSFENAKPTVGWGGNLHEETAATEADARGKLLIYLLTHGLQDK